MLTTFLAIPPPHEIVEISFTSLQFCEHFSKLTQKLPYFQSLRSSVYNQHIICMPYKFFFGFSLESQTWNGQIVGELAVEHFVIYSFFSTIWIWNTYQVFSSKWQYFNKCWFIATKSFWRINYVHIWKKQPFTEFHWC